MPIGPELWNFRGKNYCEPGNLCRKCQEPGKSNVFYSLKFFLRWQIAMKNYGSSCKTPDANRNAISCCTTTKDLAMTLCKLSPIQRVIIWETNSVETKLCAEFLSFYLVQRCEKIAWMTWQTTLDEIQRLHFDARNGRIISDKFGKIETILGAAFVPVAAEPKSHLPNSFSKPYSCLGIVIAAAFRYFSWQTLIPGHLFTTRVH